MEHWNGVVVCEASKQELTLPLFVCVVLYCIVLLCTTRQTPWEPSIS